MDSVSGTDRRALALRPIGVIRSAFTSAVGTPVQPCFAAGAEGRVIVAEPFAAALQDLDGFERIWLLYWMDRAGGFEPRVVPYRDSVEHGLFATRAPSRPNPIGLSAVRLLRREGDVLHVADLDILDGTTLLDLKPYVPAFDAHPHARAGWFDDATTDRRLADARFHPGASGDAGPREGPRRGPDESRA